MHDSTKKAKPKNSEPIIDADKVARLINKAQKLPGSPKAQRFLNDAEQGLNGLPQCEQTQRLREKIRALQQA